MNAHLHGALRRVHKLPESLKFPDWLSDQKQFKNPYPNK